MEMIWNYKTPGIPDEFFDRIDNVPITKEDIRSIIISKLRLQCAGGADLREGDGTARDREGVRSHRDRVA
jgi:hypothetical protein